MTDRERSVIAAIVAVGSAALVLVGLIVTRYVDFLGWALLTLGAFGVIDAAFIGLGLRSFGSHTSDNPHGPEHEK